MLRVEGETWSHHTQPKGSKEGGDSSSTCARPHGLVWPHAFPMFNISCSQKHAWHEEKRSVRSELTQLRIESFRETLGAHELGEELLDFSLLLAQTPR